MDEDIVLVMVHAACLGDNFI